MIKFIKNLFKKHKQLNISVVMCSVCGSDNVTSETKYELKFKVKGTGISQRRYDIRESYISHTCQNCGNVWR
jgi:hypothetical protein